MEDIRPTAKWANRMLRPLTSIYRRLEKHNEILTSIAHSKLKERHGSTSIGHVRSSRATSAEERCSYSDEEPDDPAWVPGRPIKRRIRHNYSSRGQRNGARRRSRLSIVSPERQRTLPGAIEIATPLITGKTKEPTEWPSIRKQLFRNSLPAYRTGAGEPQKATRTNNSSFPAYQGSWKEVLDLSGDAGLVEIATVLDRIFIKFLCKTRSIFDESQHQQQQRGGTRSLLSMAARCLPEFIAEEQKLQDQSEEDGDTDMCDAYFTELEAHYAPGGSGWLPLREAVRAQGIYLVSNIIQNGWITKLAACRLVEECRRHGEVDAFEQLLSKHLATVNTYDYPTAFDPYNPTVHCDDPIQILGDYYSRCTGDRSFIFDQMSQLLLGGTVPAEWMVTHYWKKCVDGAIKSLSTEETDSAAARRLIESVILSAAGIHQASDVVMSRVAYNGRLQGRTRDARASTIDTANLLKDQSPCPVPIRDALNNLVSSLIIALCGMYIARSQPPNDGKETTAMKVRNTLRHLAFVVQRTIGFESSRNEADLRPFQSLRRGYVLLGDCILHSGETQSFELIGLSDSISKRNLDAYFLSMASHHDIIRELAGLCQRVIRFYDHKHKCDQSATPPEIRSRVSQLTQLTNAGGASVFLAKVAAEAAMGFAETTLDSDDHIWADEVQQEAVLSQQKQEMKPDPASSNEALGDRTGLYRWEESIGEWVASTPAAKSKSTPLMIAARQDSERSQKPSTIACSTSSVSPSPSYSKETASSVTSSAPSVSTKRAYTGTVLPPGSCKRLRSTPEENPASERGMSAGRVLGEESPVAARTRSARGALRELVQTNAPKRFAVNSGTSSMKRTTTRVEVVIVNKDVSPVTPMTGRCHSKPTERRTRLLRRQSLSTAAPKVPIVPTTPATRRWTIPCSQDDGSDDELSFL